MSSRRRSIIKFLPEARNSSAFSVEIYIKDFTREIICESLKYFLRSNPHKNPRNTRRTRILVEDYSYDFYLDFEPVRRSIIKRSYRATYCCAFWYEIFVKDSDVTPKSWTVYLICFDVVSCIVQDSCRA